MEIKYYYYNYFILLQDTIAMVIKFFIFQKPFNIYSHFHTLPIETIVKNEYFHLIQSTCGFSDINPLPVLSIH